MVKDRLMNDMYMYVEKQYYVPIKNSVHRKRKFIMNIIHVQLSTVVYTMHLP